MLHNMLLHKKNETAMPSEVGILPDSALREIDYRTRGWIWLVEGVRKDTNVKGKRFKPFTPSWSSVIAIHEQGDSFQFVQLRHLAESLKMSNDPDANVWDNTQNTNIKENHRATKTVRMTERGPCS